MGILSDLLQDNSHSGALYDLLETRKAAQADSMGASASDRFTDLSTFKSIPKEFQISWVAGRSDMSEEEVVQARARDEDSSAAMMVFGSQLPKTLRFPQEASIKPVMQKILDKASALTGNRLDKFKASGLILADGTADFSQACYKPVFSANRETLTIAHYNGDIVRVQNHGITSEHRLKDNNHDRASAFVRRPQPPIKLHLFFAKEKTGPFRYKQLTQNSKEFLSICEQSVEEWEAAKAATTAQVGVLTSQAKSALEDHVGEIKKDRAAKARKELADKLEAKRQKRESEIPVGPA